LRFPVEAGSPLGALCPRCRTPTEFVDRTYTTEGAPAPIDPPCLQLELLVDNVRSIRNVGAMFRTADGAGIAHAHLGGFTPTPAHPQLAKTALGSELAIAWTHAPDALRAAEALVDEGATLWAIEGGAASSSLYDPSTLASRPTDRLVLVVGHEVSGVDPRILALCRRIVHVPMLGTKDSLNVAVALGVVAYTLRFLP
jgi:tRNA G18 (ribose-2'-O)-methylase SpoU